MYPSTALPVVIGDTLFFAQRDARLYAHNKNSGEPIAAVEIGTNNSVEAPELVFSDGGLYSLLSFGCASVNPRSMTRNWKYDTSHRTSLSSISVSDQYILFGGEENIIILDKADGAFISRYTLGRHEGCGSALFDDGIVYASTWYIQGNQRYARILAIEAYSGEVVWSDSLAGESFFTKSLQTRNHLYLNGYDKCYVVEKATGEILLESDTAYNNRSRVAPVLFGEEVIFGGESGFTAVDTTAATSRQISGAANLHGIGSWNGFSVCNGVIFTVDEGFLSIVPVDNSFPNIEYYPANAAIGPPLCNDGFVFVNLSAGFACFQWNH